MKSFTRTLVRTYTPLWVHKDFTIYSESYIKIRSGMEHQMDTCFKCNRKFELGESFALVCLKEVGNEVFCNKCAEEIS